jgi:hypothetical protein
MAIKIRVCFWAEAGEGVLILLYKNRIIKEYPAPRF